MVYYITYKEIHGGLDLRVKAPYATLNEARIQADHDVKVNGRESVRIEDEKGKILENYDEYS